MEWFKIDGREYNVLVIDLSESFTILYSENSGRTLEEGSPMYLDPLGTFIGHRVKIKRKKGYEAEYDELYDYLLKPRKVDNETNLGIDVEIAHNQTKIAYKAYISTGSRSLKKIENGKLYWGELNLNIVPIKAQILLED